MKRAPLLEMTVRYTEIQSADPLNGEGGREGIAWALRQGRVDGARIRGTYRGCNHPHRRADNVNVPDVHGMITTEDGAHVYYEIHAYGLLEPGRETRRVVGSRTFRTGAAPYSWLNAVFGRVQGAYERSADGLLSGRFRAYECIPEV